MVLGRSEVLLAVIGGIWVANSVIARSYMCVFRLRDLRVLIRVRVSGPCGSVCGRSGRSVGCCLFSQLKTYMMKML